MSQFNYDDMRGYVMDATLERELVESQSECTFIWANSEGWPVGVIMSYIWHGGAFWLSASSLRKRVRAVERDPRVAICISSLGTDVGAMRTVTYKGHCEVFDDDATKRWFLPVLAARFKPDDDEAQQLVVRLNDTPNRRVLKVTPVQRIAFDGAKMEAATAAAIERGDV